MTVAASGRFETALSMAMTQSQSAVSSAAAIKTRGNAQDFEAMFLNSMFQHMMTGIEGDGPFGGSTGVGVWRSFLTDEFAKSIAKKGGIGLADQVYGQLITLQAANSQSAQRGVQKGGQ